MSIICVDFERAPCAIKQSNQIKLPEEFIIRLSQLLSEGECFWFFSLSKNGFRQNVREYFSNNSRVCMFSFKCTEELEYYTQGLMEVIPFERGRQLRNRIVYAPSFANKQLVSWAFNRDRI